MLLADRVAQTTSSVGNAVGFDLTAGAKTGHRTFGAGVGYGIVTYYAIVHQTSGEWEVGIGSVTAGAPDQLQRTTVLSSSNAGARVNFSAGTKDVFVNLPAAKVIAADENGLTTVPAGLTAAGDVTVSVNSASTFRMGLINAGTGQVGFLLRRTGGTATEWEIYSPAGSTDYRLYNGGDRFVFSAGGLLTVRHASGADGVGHRWLNTSNNQEWEARIGRAGLENTSWSVKDITAGQTRFILNSGSFSQAELYGPLLIDQGAGDGEILTLRSSDVTHGMTTITDTSTYGMFRKNSDVAGALDIFGLSEGAVGLVLRGYATSEDTTKSISSSGAVYISGRTKSGTTVGPMGANSNILIVEDGASTRFILDKDGDSHQDVGTAWTNFDTHDDIALLNLLAAKVTRRGDPLRQKFGRFLRKNRKELERVGLVSFNRDGHHFVNMSRLTMLHTGALRQLGAQLARVIKTLIAVGIPKELLLDQPNTRRLVYA